MNAEKKMENLVEIKAIHSRKKNNESSSEAQAYLEPSRGSVMEFFVKITIFAKKLHRLGSKYTSEKLTRQGGSPHVVYFEMSHKNNCLSFFIYQYQVRLFMLDAKGTQIKP